MSLTLLVICLVLLAIPLAWVALKLLFRLPVLKHFAQGAVALTAAGLAGLALFTAWDLTSYRALLEETPVAELTFYRQAPQQYRVELRVEDESREFLLYGDQWQLDARMIKWQSVVARLGVDPLFRLERVSGRYASVVDELNRPRSVYALGESRGLDLWHWPQVPNSSQQRDIWVPHRCLSRTTPLPLCPQGEDDSGFNPQCTGQMSG